MVVTTRTAASSAVNPDRPTGLRAVRAVEAAELLRVVTSLHLEGLLSDTEYQVARHRLVAQH